jgi:hypothetical protein
MLVRIASWFQRPTVLIWAAYFSALEILSWALADAPGCLISADQNDYTSYHDNEHGCPTFFRGLLLLLGRLDGFFEHHDKSIIASFTIVLALSTIGLWFSTYRLWEAGEQQIRTSRQVAALQARQTRASIREATRAADAAHAQVEIARRTLTELERPYLFIFGVRVILKDSETNDYFVQYTVANFGKMPAIIEAPHIGFEISDRGEPPIPTRLHDGHRLISSPILQAGDRREEIREYFPVGMTGEGVAVIFTVGEQISGTEPDLRPCAEVPEFTVPDGFDIFFRAVIRYRGPFSQGHETGALWLYMGDPSFEFAVRGGDEYNYVK